MLMLMPCQILDELLESVMVLVMPMMMMMIMMMMPMMMMKTDYSPGDLEKKEAL